MCQGDLTLRFVDFVCKYGTFQVNAIDTVVEKAEIITSHIFNKLGKTFSIKDIFDQHVHIEDIKILNGRWDPKLHSQIQSLASQIASKTAVGFLSFTFVLNITIWYLKNFLDGIW